MSNSSAQKSVRNPYSPFPHLTEGSSHSPHLRKLSLNKTLPHLSRSKLLRHLYDKKVQLRSKSNQNTALSCRFTCLRKRALKTQSEELVGEIRKLREEIQRKKEIILKVEGDMDSRQLRKMEKRVKRFYEIMKKEAARAHLDRNKGQQGESKSKDDQRVDLGEQGQLIRKENQQLTKKITEQQQHHKYLEKKIASQSWKMSVNLKEKLRIKQTLSKL